MTMTDADVCREYRQAKDKKEQIKILADQNLCAPSEIRAVLARCGELEPASPWPDSHKGGRSRGPEWDTEKARALYDEGRNDAEIARALGLVPSTIAKWRHSEGLPSVRSLKKRRASEAMKSETASAPEPLASMPQLLPLSGQAGPVELSIDVQGCALSLQAPDLERAVWLFEYAGRVLSDLKQAAKRKEEI